MFFSVLVAAYNAEKYIDRCIESIVNQTEKDFELIIVDDGSKDNSLKLCMRWQKQYPELIRVVPTKNQGSLIARRRCFEESKGEFIYILDADDYIMGNDFLSKAKEILKNKDCDMLFFNATNYEDKRPLYNYGFENNEVFEGESLSKIYDLIVTTKMFNPLWTKIFKRKMIDWNTDYEQYKSVSNGTDAFQLIPILFSCKRIVYWDEVCYYYRVDNNSSSIIHKFNPGFYNSVRSIFDRLCFYINGSSVIPSGMYDEKLKLRWLSSMASAVYKIRQAKSENKEAVLSYLKKLREDDLLAEYYTRERIKKLSASRRAILRLLMNEKYGTLIFLIGFMK